MDDVNIEEEPVKLELGNEIFGSVLFEQSIMEEVGSNSVIIIIMDHFQKRCLEM
jgi:hypothetical protein